MNIQILLVLLLPFCIAVMAVYDLVFLIRNRLPSRSVFTFTTLPVLLGVFFIAGRLIDESAYFCFLISMFIIAFVSAICNTAFGFLSRNRIIKKYHLVNSLILNAFSGYLLYASVKYY